MVLISMGELDKEWVVRKCDSAQHLALVVMMLEDNDYEIKTLDTENLVVLAHKKGKEILHD